MVPNSDPSTVYCLGSAQQELDSTDKNMDALNEASDLLPYVDPNTGMSECGFAEALYRKKEERAWLLRRSIADLENLVHGADEHVDQLQRELREADFDAEVPNYHRLNAEIQIKRNQRMRVSLRQKIELARQVLEESKLKRFPGMKPVMSNADLYR
jgi:hypothetical protein